MVQDSKSDLLFLLSLAMLERYDERPLLWGGSSHRITEPQDVWGQKGPLEIIQSKTIVSYLEIVICSSKLNQASRQCCGKQCHFSNLNFKILKISTCDFFPFFFCAPNHV